MVEADLERAEERAELGEKYVPITVCLVLPLFVVLLVIRWFIFRCYSSEFKNIKCLSPNYFTATFFQELAAFHIGTNGTHTYNFNKIT